MKEYAVAVVGATGAVGEEMVFTLEQRNFPVKSLRPLASERSIGKTVRFKGEDIPVEVLDKNSFKGIDIALFSAGGSISKQFAPIAAESGAIVVDNTSHFRMDKDIPLVVPEVNPDDVAMYKNRGIIANPNCSTIQMVVALKPILDNYGIKRIVVSTYQATSGAGKKAMEELVEQTKAWFEFKYDECKPNKIPKRIAFNCVPHIDVFFDDGYTKEEVKMINETRKIFHKPGLPVTATCVRVPVFRGHSESVNVETEKPFDLNEVRELLNKSPGCKVVDNPANLEYPTAIDAAGKDETFIGRIRRDESVENGLNLWVVSDNLRKGAALNAVQIAEILIKEYL
ncbi:aspartate-semialdehyde dehydrogenase [Hippea maritima]|uniref:Aspartate-semialdehyde dehydrogenase n=1 Tax=Hippea maritima (strain ATCC 700847 / DSM 10411 / MH2) TaxID=760142 RepID=F2LWG6_HIPMA|nr:aspartate-semialdehyde dehydrogenase [Hippea maritima]AEA34075.1 aspartate-semialdehyde dehydrogenase [Hippea maritima DSM 10411]